MRRKVLIGAGVFVGLLVILALALPAFLDINKYRPQIQAKLEQHLGREVFLGEMGLRILPLAFTVRNATIGEHPEFQTGRPFAETAALYVKPQFLPLLRGNIQIDSLRLDSPKLELIRNAEGRWNFSTIGDGKDENGRSFSLDELRINDGEVAVTDLQERRPRALYDRIDLILYDYAPDKSFSIELTAHMPGAGDQVIVLNGDAGPIDREQFARTPFEGTLELREISLSALQRFLNAEALENSEAILTGRADIRNDNGQFASTGQFKALDGRIRGVEIGYPIAVDYELTGSAEEKSARIVKADLMLGRTPIGMTGLIDGGRTPASIDVNVRAANASIREAARLAAAFGVALNPKTNVDGTLNVDLHAKGPASRLALDGSVSARGVRITGADLKQPVEADALELALTPDVIRSNEFTARTGETSVRAQFTLSNYASEAPQLNFSLNGDRIDVRQWQEIANPRREAKESGAGLLSRLSGSGQVAVTTIVYDDIVLNNVRSAVKMNNGLITLSPLTAEVFGGQQSGAIVIDARTTPVTYTVDGKLAGVNANQFLSAISPVKDAVFGSLAASADTSFTATGQGDGIAESLNGKFSLNLRDGSVANVDMLHQLASIGQFTRTAKAVEPLTKLIQLTGDFDLSSGVARTQNLQAAIEGATVTAAGAIDLPRQALNLRITAVLSPEYSRAVGGQNVGGFMTTVLANRSGELVIPVIVTGTFKDPLFAPDLQKVAEMKLQNLLPTSTGILDRLLRGENPIEDIFDGVFGRQKPK